MKPNKAAVMVMGVAVAVGGATLALSYLSLNHDHARMVAALGSPVGAPNLVASAVTSTSSVHPSWLPAGATLIDSGAVTAGAPSALAANLATGAPSSAAYQLAGAANANTVPAAGVTDAAEALAQHPATALTVVFVPASQGPPPEQDPYTNTSTVSIAGHTATVTTTGQYGPMRIEWVDANGYHAVSCARLHTSSGISGLSLNDLTHVATSLYP